MMISSSSTMASWPITTRSSCSWRRRAITSNRIRIRSAFQFYSNTCTTRKARLFRINIYSFNVIRSSEEELTFQQLVERCAAQLEGAFALVVKSRLYPNELIATRRSSPLLIGINSSSKLVTDHIPILYSKGDFNAAVRPVFRCRLRCYLLTSTCIVVFDFLN